MVKGLLEHFRQEEMVWNVEQTRAVAGEVVRQGPSVKALQLYAREKHTTKNREKEKKMKQNIGEFPETDTEPGRTRLRN